MRMLDDPKREAWIAELAEAIAEEYCPNEVVQPEVIARMNDITYSYNYYGDSYDGLLEYRNERFHIYCNLSRTGSPDSVRSRFTFGHELGHYYIDEHRRTLKLKMTPHPSTCEFSSKNVVEKEADWFSSNLLIPQGRLLKEVRSRKKQKGLDVILKLAEIFKTSISSTAMRYVYLDLFPCALIKWGTDKNFEYMFPSSSLMNLWVGRSIKSMADTGRDSATNLVAQGNGDLQKTGTTLSTWFSNVSRSDLARNAIFIEEAMKLGSYGYLTFISPDEIDDSFSKQADKWK